MLKSRLTYGGPNSRLSASPLSSLPTSVQVELVKAHTHKKKCNIGDEHKQQRALLFLCFVAVIYKTSLLHLQPRQMTIYLPEVRKISHDFMSLPVFNPNVFSEDEDDLPGKNDESDISCPCLFLLLNVTTINEFPCVFSPSHGSIRSGRRQPTLYSQHSHRSHTQPCPGHVSNSEYWPCPVSSGQPEHPAGCSHQPYGHRSSCSCSGSGLCPSD